MSIQKYINPKENCFIEASAGTGKTYTIQQIVAQLIDEGCPLQKILIVTYTEKAAGELKDRIRKKIEEVLETETPETASVKAFDKALREVDNASIFTIHSFCQKALKEFAYDAGRPFDLGTIDDAEVESFVHAWFRDKWPQDSKFCNLLDEYGSAESLERTFCKKLVNAVNLYRGSNNGEELVRLDDGNDVPFDKMPENFEEFLKWDDFAAAFKVIQSEEDTPFTAAKKNAPAKTLGDFANDLRKWTLGQPLYDGNDYNRRGQYKKWSQELKNAFDFFAELKDDLESLAEKIISKHLHQFLYSQIPSLFDIWQKYKAENKVQSFNDMILSVHHAVVQDGASGLCEKLRNQYKYAIIDEFQDTNQLQWDIFRALFLQDSSHSIFVVGDPKQSIYSFQGADVNVYRNAVKEIGKGKTLDHNYRSTNGIIEACNELFGCGEFFGDTCDFGKSYPPGGKDGDSPSDAKKQKLPPLLYNEFSGQWEECKSFWISEKDVNETIFAQSCVEQIIRCCSFVETPSGPKTKLQIFDKEKDGKRRNVTFKDFAILARVRSEMEPIEKAMSRSGVPFSRYKDDKLFVGRECAEWISLFKAIDAPDFTSWNRCFLNEVLITDFFGFAVKDVESTLFDDPMSDVRKMIARWKDLARRRRFAELQEAIYEDSQIESRLMDLSKLQNLAKLRQIGNYAINYLYNHSCTMKELVRHLQSLANFSGDVDDQDGKLVAKASDFDAVQVMTIHASKGLEFPVVISVAGFKSAVKNSGGPFLYHSEGQIHLGYGEDAREARSSEELEEWRRLFYVDFTRPSSILMLPRYKHWGSSKGSEKKEFAFLSKSMESICAKVSLYSKLASAELWTPAYERTLKKNVQKDVFAPQKQKSDNEIAEAESRDLQEIHIQELQKSVSNLAIIQHSYSTLSGKVENSISIEDDENLNKEGSAESFTENSSDGRMGEEERIHYPKGSKLGNAIHSIFEHTNFQDFGLLYPDLESCEKSEILAQQVDAEFRKQSLPIWNHKEEWTRQTLKYVWNTLNGKFIAMEGGKLTGKSFKLTEIPPQYHKAEVQFNLNASDKESGEASEYLQNICKGFMDLMFMRKDSEGNVRYSILDWKSDVSPNGDYSQEAVRRKVDEEYSVQRVLYSYCLIKWLKQFYGSAGDSDAPMTESEIFDKYFGGIYYVFVRGTNAGTNDGIYAHTWKDFKHLQDSYGLVRKLMHKHKEGA